MITVFMKKNIARPVRGVYSRTTTIVDADKPLIGARKGQTMSKEQIEEMAKCCTYHHNGECCADTANICACDLMCEMFGVFANLENAGYRKQSEWISVDERLPEPNEHCLVAVKVGERMVVDFGELVLSFDYRTMERSYAWSIMDDWDEGDGCEITHWMPLPVPP